MTKEDWSRLEQSLNRLEVEQVEQRLAVSPVLFAGGSETTEPADWLDCSRPDDDSTTKLPDRSLPLPWPSSTGPTFPDAPTP